MLNLQQAEFDYEPYPIGLIRPTFEAEFYERLRSTYPGKELFEFKPALGNKYSLSEINNAGQYADFIRTHSAWRDFYAHVKSDAFIEQILEFMKVRHIDLGIRRYRPASKKRIGARASPLSRLLRREELSARFEFSMMDADGGHIRPHTDAANKLITLVFSMTAPGEWDPSWGGGTDIVLPTDRTRIYNHINRSMDFSEVEVLRSLPFDPNQCVIFVKTFNSWHSVSPMRGAGRAALRKTLTVNIESKT